MDTQHLTNLISNLDDPDPSVREEVRRILIEHAGEKEVLDEFLNVLYRGSKSKRVSLVDVLSDIHTEQAFELLMYAAHDAYRWVGDRVIDNLKETSDESETLFFVEAELSHEENPKSTARERALAFIKEHKSVEKRKYFLPLLKNYLDTNRELDLTVRGRLLSVLARHDVLDGIENLIDTAKYGDFDGKEYAIEKLDSILNDDVRKRIYYALLDAFQQEHHPDIRSLFEKTLHPENGNKTIYDAIQSSSDWFAQAVLYFRQLGFYQEHKDVADDDLVKRIKNLRRHEDGEKLAHNTRLLLILAEDKKRVWYCDTEIHQEFEKLLKAWGAISCGEFLPENIVETRSKNDDVIHIRFRHKNQPMEILANDYVEWIDISILEEINETIKSSGIQFCDIITDTQEACIVSLTASQKMHLEKDLGLKFDLSGRYISPPKL